MLATRLSYTNKIAAVCTVTLVSSVCFARAAWAVPTHTPQVQVIDAVTQTVQHDWLAFDEDYTGGLSVASGDIDGDGRNEVIVAQSGGADAHGVVQIYSAEGKLKNTYQLFAQDIIGAEVSLAVGNVDTDTADEIVIGLSTGTRSMVYMYDGQMRFDVGTVGAFEAFPKQKTGVHVAIANVTGSKAGEIIVGTGAGVEARVSFFNTQGKSIAKDILPFAATDTNGVVVTGLHHTTGFDDIAVAQATGNTAVKQYRIDDKQTYPVVNETSVWTREYISGLSLAGMDYDHDGVDELVAAPAGDQLGEIRVLNQSGKSQLTESLIVYEEDFRGGLDIAVSQLDADAAQEYVIVPHIQKQRGDKNRTGKFIEVNLTTQTESLWEDAYLRNVYLISSGLPGTPSPEGEFSILKKYETHVYDGRPYYYFPNTKWNLMYKPGGPESNYYFHTAYWHNNFGHPMSHGCINMREADAKFLFFWADIGTPALLHK